MFLRKHQKDFSDYIDSIISGQNIKTILCRCTPGSGKSALPVIAGKLIAAGMADGICWIVPRTALQSQGERNFLDPNFRQLLGHNLKVRASTNELNPARGVNGFVTTYQAIGIDRQNTVCQEISKRRYIVVLDEFHHVEKCGVWDAALSPIVDAAKFLILMTGTLQRGDDKQIAFIPYIMNRKRIYEPDIDSSDWKVVQYSRADALVDRAIIPMQFFFHDGEAEWISAQGYHRQTRSIANLDQKDVGAALYTALKTDYAKELLEMTINHWLKYKKRIKTAKLLIVTANYENAKQVTAMVRKLIPHKPVEIATSHESVAGLRAIQKFKSNALDVLITIAMAYEGLDCPEISHIACLTHIRSTPWIEQMIARAVRIDKAYTYESQAAYIFCPDDPLMRSIVDQIQQEQIACIESLASGEKDQIQMTLFGEEEVSLPRLKVEPIGSRLTTQNGFILGNIGSQLESEKNEAFQEQYIMTPKEQEKSLLRQIETHVRIYCANNRYKPQSINAEIKKHFGKSRADMTGAELAFAYNWVKQNYPIDYQVRGRCVPVSRKVEAFSGEWLQ